MSDLELQILTIFFNSNGIDRETQDLLNLF